MCVYIHEAVLSCQVPRSHLGEPGGREQLTSLCHVHWPLVSEPPPGRSGRSQPPTPMNCITCERSIDRGLTAGPPCLLEMCLCTHILHQVTQ